MFLDVYRGSRVLVTGHTGFKGSWLARWLTDLGAEVAGLSLYLPSQPSHFEALGLERRIRHIVADVRDAGAVAAAVGEWRADFVFHLAAQPLVREAYASPKLTFDTNLGGTVNVLEAVRRQDSVRAAVLITSDKCYENLELERGYDESDRLGGADPYSASKACAEIAISAYARSFLLPAGRRVASTRAGNVIGGGDWAADRVVPDCVRAWSRGEQVALRNPTATRPWQHVLEPLSGYLWLGACLATGRADVNGEAFNFGPAPAAAVTVGELVEALSRHWPRSAWSAQPANDGKPEASLLQLDCDKALRRLGWRAVLDFAETARYTARWYRGFYDGAEADRLTGEQIAGYCASAAARGDPWTR